MIVTVSVVSIFIAFAVGTWYGQRRCRDEFSEQYRVAMAAHRLHEYHRLHAEHKAFRKIDLTPRPIFDGEIVKVSLN